MVYFNNFIIYKDRLLKNVQKIKEKIGNKKLCAMVKADAYGHKSALICEILKDKVDYFGVANVCEAKSIRSLEIATPILVVGKTSNKDYFYCSKHNIDIAVSSIDELVDITKTLRKCSINVHIAINTGMNRFGVKSIDALKEMIDYIDENKRTIKLVGVFTHFATKASDVDFIDRQYQEFEKYIAQLPKSVICHASSSFATFNVPHTQCDMVRCGYYLYNGEYCIREIYAKVIDICNVRKGESVGYDRTYFAKRDRQIAIVSLGYADGLDRRLSNNFSLYIKEHFCPIIGNVCMDVCMVDVTNLGVKIKDEVEIIGPHINYNDYAKALDTSVYDVMLKFRYKRMNLILK